MIVEESKSRWVVWRKVAAVLFLLSVSTGLGLRLAGGDLYSEYRVRQLLTPDYNQQRPAGGRLFGVAHSVQAQVDGISPSLGKAQRILLSFPDGDARKKLQSLIHIASQDWIAAAATLTKISQNEPENV